MPLAAAFLAALSAHVAIDVAGDYLLAHDTYDDHVHGSRYVASFALLASALAALCFLARAVLAETRGARDALKLALRASIPKSISSFAVVVTGVTVPLLLGMAWLDSVCAGVPVDDLADLFGGSLALGIGITVAFALVAAVGVHHLVALATRYHRSIVRAIGIVVHAMEAARGASVCLSLARHDEDRPRVPAALARCTGADRAPPFRMKRIRPA